MITIKSLVYGKLIHTYIRTHVFMPPFTDKITSVYTHLPKKKAKKKKEK